MHPAHLPVSHLSSRKNPKGRAAPRLDQCFRAFPGFGAACILGGHFYWMRPSSHPPYPPPRTHPPKSLSAMLEVASPERRFGTCTRHSGLKVPQERGSTSVGISRHPSPPAPPTYPSFTPPPFSSPMLPLLSHPVSRRLVRRVRGRARGSAESSSAGATTASRWRTWQRWPTGASSAQPPRTKATTAWPRRLGSLGGRWWQLPGLPGPPPPPLSAPGSGRRTAD